VPLPKVLVTIKSEDPVPSIPQTTTDLLGIRELGKVADVELGAVTADKSKVTIPVLEALNFVTAVPLKLKLKGMV